MKEVPGELAFMARWLGHRARDYALRTWRELPGPAWVKIIILVTVAALGAAIPGPWDEAIMIAGVRAATRLARRLRKG